MYLQPTKVELMQVSSRDAIDTAYVNGFYWSEYGGLFKETLKLVFDGNKIVEYETIAEENIYKYDCGIMF